MDTWRLVPDQKYTSKVDIEVCHVRDDGGLDKGDDGNDEDKWCHSVL